MPYFFRSFGFSSLHFGGGVHSEKFNLSPKILRKKVEFLHSNWTFYPSVYVLKGRNIEVCKALHFWSFLKKTSVSLVW